ncbi:MAG TPA: SPASM domain-containing protein [Thermoanaerobaculia bacterium]|nr:SPASM domain-containing protein [Thermoanaerobaculia bacterium]
MGSLGWSHLTPEDREAILRGIADGEAYGGPYHVEIHPVDRCNVDGSFCATAALRGTDEAPLPRFTEMLGELREAGTRSLRLSGGGEPLLHRRIHDFLQAIVASRLPVENLTTNGVLLAGEVREVLVAVCDQITVSLNTGDEATYAAMMRTTPRNLHRVVDNVRGLLAARDGRRRRRESTPRVHLQFLVHKGNYRTIPGMYELARGLGVDSIAWNGLAFLAPQDKMTAAEIDEMRGLYEEVVQVDRQASLLRGQSLLPVEPIGGAVSPPLSGMPPAKETFDDLCLIGWHSMVVRATGGVAPCGMLQGKDLGNVYRQSVHRVWHGEAYRRFRAELTRILRRRLRWEHDPELDRTVEPLCGPCGGCPIASPYGNDLRFRRSFQATLERLAHAPAVH